LAKNGKREREGKKEKKSWEKEMIRAHYCPQDKLLATFPQTY